MSKTAVPVTRTLRVVRFVVEGVLAGRSPLKPDHL